MNDQHVGENAELYALGSLDEHEQRRVLEHVAGCTACASLVGDAERTVSALEALGVPQVAAPAELDARFAALSTQTAAPQSVVFELPRRWSRLTFQRNAALAASVALFAGGAFAAHDATSARATLGTDDAALRVLSESHFNHATFHTDSKAGFIAKAIFGRGAAGWIYIIADTASCRCRPVGIATSGELELGSFVQQGDVSTLFVPDAADVVKVELRSGNATIASVHVTR